MGANVGGQDVGDGDVVTRRVLHIALEGVDAAQAQTQAVPLARQPQHLVGRIAVGQAAALSAHPDGHRPDPGRQLAPVLLLQPGPDRGECGPPVRVEGRQFDFLPAGAQVEVALQEETDQLPCPVLGVFLHPFMGQEQSFGRGEGIDEK